MFGRLAKRIGCLIAIVALAGWAPAADRSGPIHRIVAVGDLHGDYAAWRDIARAAGLIDAQGQWSGGETVLVQTGDVVDRGPDSLKIVLDLRRLQHDAPRAGGRVVTLVGNHEAMNVTDDLRYVSAGDYAAFADNKSAALRDRAYDVNQAAIEAAYRRGNPDLSAQAIHETWLAATPLGKIEHQIAWHPEGDIGRWVVSNPAVVLLDGTLFVHGGISESYARMPITEINRGVARALSARAADLKSIINDAMGPLWYRGLVTRDPEEEAAPAATPAAPSPEEAEAAIDRELGVVLAAYHARRIVVGHTPILTGIAVLHEGRLIRIDTGISAVYGGTPSYLEILDGVAIPHAVERSTPSGTGAG